jgi:hypothetical protein
MQVKKAVFVRNVSCGAINGLALTTAFVIMLVASGSQTTIASPVQDAAAKEQLQAKIADVKASLAKNQEALRQYTWMETTEISLKGEVKSKTQNSCSYGPDGKVEKKLVSAPAEKKAPPRGLKGKIVENKVDDLKDYMEQTAGTDQTVHSTGSGKNAGFVSGRKSCTHAAICRQSRLDVQRLRTERRQVQPDIRYRRQKDCLCRRSFLPGKAGRCRYPVCGIHQSSRWRQLSVQISSGCDRKESASKDNERWLQKGGTVAGFLERSHNLQSRFCGNRESESGVQRPAWQFASAE